MKNSKEKISNPTLYVITEPRYIPESTINDILDRKCSIDPCVKIGYTEDLKSRLSLYNSDSPGFKILFIIEDPTITKFDEDRLHQYFQKYRKGKDLNGREWFIFDWEIYNFFNTYKTIQEIRDVIPAIEVSDKQLIRLRDIITPILSIMIMNKIGFSKTEKIPSITELQNKYVTKTQYFANYEEFIDFLRDELSEEEINFILNEFNRLKPVFDELTKFKNISQYTNKLKYVFELEKTMDKEYFALFLNSIPISYKNYYTVLGEKKCISNSFRKSELEKEYQNIVNNQTIDIESEICKIFKVGDKFPRPYIKETLSNLYKSLNYVKSAKALDLEEFFVLKAVKIKNSDGKWENGLEIISKK